MNKSLRLTILTPAEVICQVQGVRWVQAQLADGGGIGIWPGHAPLLAETVTAPLRYADDTGEQALDLAAGILQIDGGMVTILISGFADVAELKRSSGAAERSAQAHGRLARTLLAASLESHENDE